MKKKVLILAVLCSSLLFGADQAVATKKVDTILSSRQDIKNRLEFLKSKELYVQELEKKFNKESFNIDLDKKYSKLEKEFLKKDLDKLINKKKFLELEKNLYKELFERMENVEKQI